MSPLAPAAPRSVLLSPASQTQITVRASDVKVQVCVNQRPRVLCFLQRVIGPVLDALMLSDDLETGISIGLNQAACSLYTSE